MWLDIGLSTLVLKITGWSVAAIFCAVEVRHVIARNNAAKERAKERTSLLRIW